MIERIFYCLNCGYRFVTMILEKGEAEAKKVQTSPVHCPKCHRTDLREDK